MQTIHAIADAVGHELPADYRTMTRDPREGELLPEHLLAQVGRPGGALMAKHTGRGISSIEYPTGMNQNGDPSQAWIKIKPDGRVDVFSGHPTSATARRRSRARSSPRRSASRTSGSRTTTRTPTRRRSAPGTFASRATFVAGNAVRKAALSTRSEKLLEIAGKELEIDPTDLESSTAR